MWGGVCQLSDCQCSRRNLGNGGHSVLFKLVTIIADPLIIERVDVSILFAICQVIILVGIEARRAILTTLRVVVGAILGRVAILIHGKLSPAAAHIATINQLSSLLTAVVVGLKNTTQPLGIAIPVVIHREHRLVGKHDADA